MEPSFTVRHDTTYYYDEPKHPKQHDLWCCEDENYIKVYTWIDDEWCVVTDMTELQGGSVKISFTNDDSEDVDIRDYQYRIGL